MPRPIARVLQEFQNAAIVASDPVLKTVIVGPHVYVREYPANRATLLSDQKIGQDLEALMVTSGASPTIPAATITTYPDAIAGAVVIDTTVKVFAEGFIEVASEADVTAGFQQNTITSAAGDFSAVAANDRVIVTPSAFQVFEDLNEDFVAAGIVAGTDILDIGGDLHNIAQVISQHRLLVEATVSAPATLGFFAAADASANVSYNIGDNGALYDNKIAAGTTGQRRTWREVKLFQDLNTDFNSAGVTAGQYLKIGADVHLIASVVDANNLLVAGGTTVAAPQNKTEFATDDALANTAYSIGTASGNFINTIDNSLAGTGQRLETLSAVRRVFSVASATEMTLVQLLPFAGTAGQPLLVRAEHEITNLNPPTGQDGWEISGVLVNATTKAITVPADSTVTYLSGARKIIDAALYVEYQALRQENTAEIKVADVNTLASDLGEDRKENPLRRALTVATANAGTARISYLAISTNDQAGHTEAQGILANDREAYCIVPLTQDASIIASYQVHANTLSTPTKGKRRIIVCQPGVLPSEKLVTSAKADGTAESATVLFSPTANFIADNVVPGDTVVLTSPTTNSYTVQSVTSGNRLVVDGPFTAPEQAATGSVAFIVTRALDKDGQVTELSAIPQSLNDRRVITTWPDSVTVGGDTGEPGYYLSCAIGAFVAALPSHRMTTRIGIAGVSEIANSNNYFNDEQIERLVDAGWYMIEQENAQAAPFTSQQYTSAGVDAPVSDRYLSSVKNFDYVSAEYQGVIDSFPGEWNVIDQLFDAVRESLNAKTRELIQDKQPRIGSPILRATEPIVEESATQSDKIEASITVQLPNVLNELDLRLIST